MNVRSVYIYRRDGECRAVVSESYGDDHVVITYPSEQAI